MDVFAWGGRPPLRRRAAAGWRFLTAVLVALPVVTLVACGPTGGAPSSGSAPVSPAASPSSGGGDSGDPSPLASQWPFAVAEAVIRLGAMHGELGTAVGELSAAVAAEDVAAIRSVAEQLATFLDRNLESARALQPTFPELGEQMVLALTTMRDGATVIRDGIDRGDGSAVTAGFNQIAAGMKAYAEVQPQIAGLVPEAIRQTGGLVR